MSDVCDADMLPGDIPPPDAPELRSRVPLPPLTPPGAARTAPPAPAASPRAEPGMPAEYVGTAGDLIRALELEVRPAVLFNHIWGMLSNGGAERNVTPGDVFNFMCVCRQLQLNPMTSQIYGFVQRGKVVVIVSVAGWSEIANRNPMNDGFTLRFGEMTERELTYQKADWQNGRRQQTPVTVKRRVPEWVCYSSHRKDRKYPLDVYTYFDEVYRPTQVWAEQPITMLQHRGYVNAIRKSFSIVAYPEDEKAVILQNEG